MRPIEVSCLTKLLIFWNIGNNIICGQQYGGRGLAGMGTRMHRIVFSAMLLACFAFLSPCIASSLIVFNYKLSEIESVCFTETAYIYPGFAYDTSGDKDDRNAHLLERHFLITQTAISQ